MAMKKPKAEKTALPFPAQEQSDDDDARRRAILMRRDLEQAEGFSWNNRPRGLVARLRSIAPHRLVSGVIALAMGFAIVIGFLVAMDSGISVPERIVFMQSWGADRTAEDAIRDREEAMDRLRAEVAANRRALEQQQAREKALAAERAAARQATS